MQDLIRRLPGVISTRVGYTGGDVDNATYRNHGTHAEAIEIIFDPQKTNYRDLLEFFFQIHDPTTRNRQGNDRRRQLPFGDLLHERRAETRRGRHHRRCRRLGTVAGQGDYGIGARRPLLAGGAGTPGLFGETTERLHLPFRPPKLEAAEANADEERRQGAGIANGVPLLAPTQTLRLASAFVR